jgi:branched-chain amino acid transport system permease protein
MMHTGAKRSLLAAIAIAIVLSLCSGYFNRYYSKVAIDVAINIVLAVSLNLINGHTGQFSLGHAGFMAVGGYIAAKITLVFGVMAAPWAQPFFFLGALVAGGLAAALAGLAVGVPSLRLRGDYLAIVTLGFGEIIRVVFQTSDTFGAATGLSAIPNWTTLAWSFGAAAITVYVVGCLVNSTYGRGFLAVHDDEIAAGAMGINPVRYKVTAFVIGAFFAGVGGGLFAHNNYTISPATFDFMKSIDIVVIVILGGMGNTAGVIVAAVLLTCVQEPLRTLGPLRMVVYALLIITLMMLRPQGLFSFGKKKAVKA